MDFWRFRVARHILRANCAETNWDRHGQAAYEIFSVERRDLDFDSPGLDFLGSRKPAHEGIKERYPRKSRDEMAGDRQTDILRTGTAIGFRASCEHLLKFLVTSIYL